MTIGLTDAALHRPTRSAAVVRSATIIIVIAVTVRIATDANVYARRINVKALRLHSGSGSKRRRANKAQSDGRFY